MDSSEGIKDRRSKKAGVGKIDSDTEVRNEYGPGGEAEQSVDFSLADNSRKSMQNNEKARESRTEEGEEIQSIDENERREEPSSLDKESEKKRGSIFDDEFWKKLFADDNNGDTAKIESSSIRNEAAEAIVGIMRDKRGAEEEINEAEREEAEESIIPLEVLEAWNGAIVPLEDEGTKIKRRATDGESRKRIISLREVERKSGSSRKRSHREVSSSGKHGKGRAGNQAARWGWRNLFRTTSKLGAIAVISVWYCLKKLWSGVKWLFTQPDFYKKSLVILAMLGLLVLYTSGVSLYKVNRQCHGAKIVLTRTYFNDPILVKVDDDKRGHDILERGYMDSNITRALGALVPVGGTVIDIGSGFGYYTLYLSRLVGERGNVFSIEAKKEVFDILKYSLMLNPHTKNVRAYNATMYSDDVVMAVQPNPNKVQASLDYSLIEHKAGFEAKDIVYARALSAFFEHLKDVDVIHINACNHEDDILLGAGELINRSPNVKIVTSWCGQSASSRGARVVKRLLMSGFHFWYLANGAHFPLNSVKEVMATEGRYPLVISKTKLRGF